MSRMARVEVEVVDVDTKLHTKYRPQSLDEVFGQDVVIKTLMSVIEKRSAQTFIFDGPSGVGKTTLARIAATMLGTEIVNRLEIDAASFTGVDDMRQIQESIKYRPFGKSSQRAVIIDEAHRLSKNAWDSLLKATEEPPPHVNWFFCTTDPLKVPTTVRTRAASFTLKQVSDGQLDELVRGIAGAEGFEVSDGIFELIVREANGSPRQALQNLALCRDLTSRQEAAQVLRTAIETDATLEFCRYIIKGSGSWAKAMEIMAKLEEDSSPEGVRIVVSNYIAAALRKSKSDKEAVRFLTVLDAFSSSYNTSDGMAPLYISLGRVLFQ